MADYHHAPQDDDDEEYNNVPSSIHDDGNMMMKRVSFSSELDNDYNDLDYDEELDDDDDDYYDDDDDYDYEEDSQSLLSTQFSHRVARDVMKIMQIFGMVLVSILIGLALTGFFIVHPAMVADAEEALALAEAAAETAVVLVDDDKSIQLRNSWVDVQQACLVSPNEKECANQCSIAKCCFIPENYDGSCLKNALTERICRGYYSKACRSVLDNVYDDSALTIPAISAKKDDYCAESNTKSLKGFLQCTGICLPGSCCFSTDDKINCEGKNSAKCDDYKKSCGTILFQKEQHHSVSVSLDEACAREDLTLCKDMCTYAKCCFTDEGCSDSSVMCEDYQPCKSVHLDEKVEEKKDEGTLTISIEDACTNNLSLCKDLCVDAQCCFAKNDSSCANDKADMCKEFAPCKAVHEKEKSPAPVPTPPKEDDGELSLSKACKSDDLTLCEDMCKGAACCFDHEAEECQSFDQNICTYFTSCSVIYSTEHTMSALKKVCSADSLQSKSGKNLCERKCWMAACCYDTSPELNCAAEEVEFCQDFEPCTVLYMEYHSKGQSIPPPPPPEATSTSSSNNVNKVEKASPPPPLPPASTNGDSTSHASAPKAPPATDSAPLTREQACTASAIMTHGKDPCEKKCHHTECCFESNPITNCATLDEEFCKEHSACKILHASAGSEIEEACSIINIQDSIQGREDCENKCYIAKCCFDKDPNKNCADEDVDFCEEFQACQILH